MTSILFKCMPKEKQNFARYAELVSTVYKFTSYVLLEDVDCTLFPRFHGAGLDGIFPGIFLDSRNIL